MERETKIVYVVSIMHKGTKLYYSHASYNHEGRNNIFHFTDYILGSVAFLDKKQTAKYFCNEIKKRYEKFDRARLQPYYDIEIFECDIDTLRVEKLSITIESMK